jgi:type II secretory pathway component PulJ
MSRRPSHRGEVGFTLVEVLVAVVIEAMIVGALGMAFIGILKGTADVSQSLSRSSDARIAAAYIISDARNSSGPEISLTDTTSCGSGTGATPVVRFNWNSTSSAGVPTANVVDYVLIGNSLVRRKCQNSDAPAIDTVGSSVASATAVCVPTANCTGTPTSITVTITETADSNGNPYVYSLTGTFRKLIGGGPPAAVIPPPIYLLGAGTCSAGSGTHATGLVIAGGSQLVVHGVADINSGDVTGAGGCTAMNIGTDAGNYQADSTRIYSGANGGTCTPNGSSTCPTITNYSPALSDPYAGLPAPAGTPAACTGTNPSPDQNGVYPSGVYPQQLQISGTATLSGTYIFCNGVYFTGGARVVGTNVLLYLQGGTMTEDGDAQVSLTAATSGSYSGLAVWQPTANSTTMTMSNGGKLSITGSIYAPSAEVYFTGGSITTTVTAIVAKSLFLDRGASVTIGTAIVNPTVTSASPTSAAQGATNVSVTIGGTKFATNAVASYSAAGITVNSTTWVSATQLTANMTVAANATVGAHNLTVTNADGGTATLSSGLTVTSTRTPTSFTITVNGGASASIAAGAQATLAESGLPGGATGTVTMTSGTTLCSFSYPTNTSCLTATTLAAGSYPISATFADTDGTYANSTSTNTVTLTVTAPPTVVGFTSTNQNGAPAASDTIAITFSSAIDPSSVCSTWSGAGAHTLNNANITVTLTKPGSGHNTMSVVDTTDCSSGLHIFSGGTLDLGTTGYVTTSTAVFGPNSHCNGGHPCASVALNAADTTLTITLGEQQSGTVGTVASNPGITYTPDPLITSGGVSVTGTASDTNPFF